MSNLPRFISCALSLACFVSVAHAEPTSNDNTGTWLDSYPDNLGVDYSSWPDTTPKTTSTIIHDAAGQAMVLQSTANSGHFTTRAIQPASFTNWSAIYVRFTAQRPEDVQVQLLDENGAPLTALVTPAASDLADWSGRVDLSNITAAQAARARVKIQLTKGTQAGAVAPTLQALRVDWVPLSVVKVTYEQPTTSCTRATIANRVRVSVSHVDATNLVVWVPLPEGVLAPNLNSATTRLEFIDASDSGIFTGTATVIDGISVPANSVYWRLGNRKSGNTFILSFNTRTPSGILNTTTYTTRAAGRSANSNVSESLAQVTTIAGNSVNRQISKSASPIYSLFGERWANASRPGAPTILNYNVNVWNQANSTCTEDWKRVVVWDELAGFNLASGGKGFVGSPTGISGNGVYTANAVTLHNQGGDGTLQPVTVPANSIYWVVDTIAAGASQNFSFSLELAQAPPLIATGDRAGRTLLRNTARVDSGYRPQDATSTSEFNVRIGIPFEPTGNYAKGDRIRGSGGVSAGNNDVANLNLGYGDPVTYLLYANNNGASALTGTWMIDRVPDGTTFSSAFLPGGANGRVFFGSQTNAANDPPAFPLTSTDCLGNPGAAWSTENPPANPAAVKWVAFCVPRLASPYFSELNVPTSVTAEFTATVNPPTSGCAETTLTNTGYFQTFGYSTPDGNFASGLGRVSDIEYTNVKPLVPSLQFTSASASPSVVTGARDIDFYFNFPNQLPGGSETDTALDVVATITLPSANVGGTTRYLDLVNYDLAGGTPDLSQLANGTLKVTWATIAPNQSRQVRVRVKVPKGLIDNTQVRASATVVGRDDVCGNVTGATSATATVRVNPYLQVSKSVNLAIAAIGSELIYNLSYLNAGDGASTGTWVIDHIPAGARFVSAGIPQRGETWYFSKSLPPVVPGSVRDDFYANHPTPTNLDNWIRTSGQWTVGATSGGRIVSPFGLNDTVTWVALKIDNKNLTPEQLPTTETGVPTSLDFRVQISNQAQNGSTLSNEAAIFSNQLVPAISNQALTIVSPNPSLAAARICPDVVANGEDFGILVTYTNNSSNQNDSVTVTETLPAGFVFSGAQITAAGQTTTDLTHVALGPVAEDGTRVLTWTLARPTGTASQLGRPMASLEASSIRILGATVAVDSGTQLQFRGLGLATNASLPQGVSVFSQCVLPVENPDLWLRIFADQPAPLPNEEVTYTSLLSNQGLNDGEDLVFEVTLPGLMTYVPGSVLITTGGWSFTPTSAPQISGNILRWSVPANNALTRTGRDPGYMPGNSGDVSITLRAKVAANTPANQTLTVCAATRLEDGSVEDANYDNSACTDVRTPQPDPYIQKVAPALAQPGGTVSYRLRYGNDSRMPATRVVLFDSLYDDPLPAPDGRPDVKFLGVTASSGEEVFFSDALIGANPPAFNFDLANPPGWRRSAAELTGPVSWIAVRVGNMTSNQPPRSVFIDVELRNPTTQATPLPASTIRNCATVLAAGPNPPPDDDTTNNSACVDTRTPGIDITLAHDCDPKGGFPGVRPGAELRLYLTLTNSGTQPAHGLTIRNTLPSWFEYVNDDAQSVTVLDAAGSPANPIDFQGQPINDPVPWTRTADGWMLGVPDTNSPYYFRRVGLGAGQSTRIAVLGTVALNVGNNIAVENTATAVTQYREDWVTGNPVEENLVNNAASCGTTVFRPDPIVLKFAADLSGGPGPVGNKDKIQYSIQYNNIGQALADQVMIEDVLPTGTAFVVGSLANVPDSVQVEYADQSGAWGYVSTRTVGQSDPAISAFRLVWDDPVRAPTNNYFSQVTALDFATGTFAGTKVTTPEMTDGGVTSGGSGGVPGQMPSFTTLDIPGPNEGNIVTWDRVVATGTSGGEGLDLFMDVIDATTGQPIEGFTDISILGGETVDISELDPSQHPNIRLRARFQGGAGSGDPGEQGYSYLSSPAKRPTTGYVELHNSFGEYFGRIELSRNNSGHHGSSNEMAVVWQPDPTAEGGWKYTPISDPDFESRYSNNFVQGADDMVVYSAYGDTGYASWVGTREADGTWTSVSLASGYYNITDANRNTILTDNGSQGVLTRQSDGSWLPANVVQPENTSGMYLYRITTDDVITGRVIRGDNWRTQVWVREGDVWNPAGMDYLQTTTYSDPRMIRDDGVVYSYAQRLVSNQNRSYFTIFVPNAARTVWTEHVIPEIPELFGNYNYGENQGRTRAARSNPYMVVEANLNSTSHRGLLVPDGSAVNRVKWLPIALSEGFTSNWAYYPSTNGDVGGYQNRPNGNVAFIWRLVAGAMVATDVSAGDANSYINNGTYGSAMFGYHGQDNAVWFRNGATYSRHPLRDENNRYFGWQGADGDNATAYGYFQTCDNECYNEPALATRVSLEDGSRLEQTRLPTPLVDDSTFSMSLRDGRLVGTSRVEGGQTLLTVWNPDASDPSGYSPSVLPGDENRPWSRVYPFSVSEAGVIVANTYGNEPELGSTWQLRSWVPDVTQPSGYRIEEPSRLERTNSRADYRQNDGFWGPLYGNLNQLNGYWTPEPAVDPGFAIWLQNDNESGYTGNGQHGVYASNRLGWVSDAEGTQRVAVWGWTGESVDGYSPTPLPSDGHSSYFNEATTSGLLTGDIETADAGSYPVLWRKNGSEWELVEMPLSDEGSYDYILGSGTLLFESFPPTVATLDAEGYSEPTPLALPADVTDVWFDEDHLESMDRKRPQSVPERIVGTYHSYDEDTDVSTYGLIVWTQTPDGWQVATVAVGEPGNSPQLWGAYSYDRYFVAYNDSSEGETVLGLTSFGEDGSLSYLNVTPSGYREARSYYGADFDDRINAVSPSGVFMLYVIGPSNNNVEQFAMIPDAAEPTGFRAEAIGGAIDFNDFFYSCNEGNSLTSSSRCPVANLISGTECWSVTDSSNNGGGEFREANFNGSSDGGDVTGNEGKIVLWGCQPLESSTLDEWAVLYRTDRNPQVDFQLEVQDLCQPSITNSASISTSTPEISSSNNSSSATIGVDTVDIKVELTTDKGSVVNGEQVTYTVTVTNLGPGVGKNINVSLLLPPQLGGSSATPPAPTQTWSIATLNRNAVRTFTRTATVNESGQQIPLTGSAVAAHPSIDCVKSNNSASATIVTGNNPNVWVRLVPPATANLFAPATWRVEYGNNGNTEATGVQLVFTLPPGFTVIDSGEVSCSAANPAVCTINDGTLDEGDPQSFEVVAQLDDCSAAGSSRQARATISADIDVNLADNNSLGSTAILAPSARMSVGMVPSRSTVEVGDAVNWTIYFRNDGSETIPNATLEALFPTGGLEIQSATVTTGATSATYTNGLANWPLGDLPSQAQGSVIVVARTLSGQSAPWTATARVEGDNICETGATSAAVAFAPTGGIRVVKTADTNAVCGSGRVKWDITVTNTHSSLQSNLVLVDTLPAGLVYAGGSIAGRGANDAGNPTLTWNIGSLAGGQGLTFSYETLSPASDGQLVTNSAHVEQNAAIIATSNPAALRVDCMGHMDIQKSWNGACAVLDTTPADGNATDSVKVNLTVTNRGQAALANILVHDWVPSCARVSNLGTGTCNGLTNQVTWTLLAAGSELPVGASRTVSFDLSLSGTKAGGIHMNKAVATANNAPTQTSNLVSGVMLSCDDGNSCTFDTCSPLGGCMNVLTPIIGASDTTCNGVDDDCDGLTDEEFVGAVTACGDGVCASTGREVCENGDIRDTCREKPILSATDTTCDNVDDDCDGDADDDFVNAPTTCGIGDCGSTGALQCTNGAVSDSCRPGTGTGEVCDNRDNDCDGLVDAADPNMVRIACDKQFGVCNGAIRPANLCVLGDWVSCPDAVYAAHSPNYSLNDLCDNFDNNCDNVLNDDFASQTTNCGVGECARTGRTECTAGLVVNTCQAGAPAAELCDNKDNDCDGQLDGADPNLVLVACEKQNGVCVGSMKTRELCVGGSFRPCTDSLYAGHAFPHYSTTDTTCDNRDNDCSGVVDNGYVSQPTSCGVGECADNAGTRTCSAGQVVDSCDPLAGSAAELCNDRDDDCDGTTDENFALKGTGCDGDDADQCEDGIWTCSGNGMGLVCNDDAGTSAVEICDNIDNNCNEQIDEGCDDDADDYCDGQMGCVSGLVVQVCANGCGDCIDTDGNRNPGRTEICNGIDDNCNGQTDEGCDDDNDDWCDATMVCDPQNLAPTCQGGCGDCNDTNVAVNPGAAEVCDLLDNNCNTQIDEGFATGGECTNGRGECTRPGRLVCASNKTDIICDAVPGTPSDELCNDLDDNCDGSVDEIFPLGDACTVGRGECTQTGINICDVLTRGMRCSVDPLPANPDFCDGRDNDCDGLVDNNPSFPGVSICPVLETEITSGPPRNTAQTTAAFTFVNPEDPTNLDFECSVDGGAWVDCTGGTLNLPNVISGSHVLLVRALGGDGSRDPTPAFYQWTVDTSVPDTFFVVAPDDPSQSPDGSIVFGTNVADPDHYMCVLDPVASPPQLSEYEVCATVTDYADLADGLHTMWVYVIDSRGVADPTPASHTWLIDTTAPDTVITSSPAKVTSSTTAPFAYEDPNDSEIEMFECRVDGGEWFACPGGNHELTGLTHGDHLFEVRSVDSNGVRDPTPARYTWTIDTRPPDTFIPVHPDDPSQNPSALFGFASDESPVSYNCVLDPDTTAEGFDDELGPDAESFTACDVTTIFEDLEDGEHTIWVFATDTAGNSDPTPATFSWVIDTRFPETAILTGPTPLSAYGTPADFTYEDPTDPNVRTFECRLDSGEWARCDGGVTAFTSEDLAVGPHAFQVRTCDYTKPVDVQCDPTPATWSWEVTESTCPNDRTAPTLLCKAGTVLECVDGGADLDLEALAPTATDACMPVTVWTASSNLVGLGTNPVVYIAQDGNANVSSCVTEVTVLDSTAPVPTCPADVALTNEETLCGAAAVLDDATGLDACQGDAGLLVIRDQPAFFQVGETLVTHRVIDASGNEGVCVQKVTVTDDEPMRLTCSESLEVDADADKCEWTGDVFAEAVDNCAVDIAVLEVEGTYPVGESPVDFTTTDEAGNLAECTTMLTVRDVTAPTVVCGEPVGAVPVVIRAAATDACGATVVLEEVTCTMVDGATETPIALVDCPIEVVGDALRITGRLPTGALKLNWVARATDDAGNVGNGDCELVYTADRDSDGILDEADNCIDIANTDQLDTDDDGLGDVCDNCAATTNEDQADGDDDGVGDVCDNCLTTSNEGQGDLDEDGLGDSCDVCPSISNVDQVDTDGDGIGDVCSDKDDDGILDADDNCPVVANDDQMDTDGDGIGDLCDEVPYENLTAEGSGGCGGGPLSLSPLLLVLVGLGAVARRRRTRV